MGENIKFFQRKCDLLWRAIIYATVFYGYIFTNEWIISIMVFKKITKVICIIMASYLTLNIVVNFISKSKKEKYIMTPLSAISAICFWLVAL